MSDPVMCDCGQPLHYSSPAVQRYVEDQIATLGRLEFVTVQGVGSWMVPRHYIALHGFKGHELAELAERHGWERKA